MNSLKKMCEYNLNLKYKKTERKFSLNKEKHYKETMACNGVLTSPPPPTTCLPPIPPPTKIPSPKTLIPPVLKCFNLTSPQTF